MSNILKVISRSNAVLASVTAVSSALIFHAVQADDFSQRFYVVGGLGLTQVEPEGSSPALTVSDDSDSGGHLGVGYDFSRFLTLEAYAATLGTAQVAFNGVDVGSVDYTVFGVNALGYLVNSRSGPVLFDGDTNGLHRREGASLYARVGLGHMLNDSTTVNYRRDYPNHAVFGLGVEYGFSNGVALRTELLGLDTDARYLNIGILKRFGSAGALPAAAAALPVIAVEEVDTPAPEPVEPKLFKAVQSPYVYFELDNAVISPEAAQTLDVFASEIADKDLDLLVEGHTDWLATEEYNMDLSERRAEAVATYLVNKGISASRVSTIGYGESRPISSNTTAAGRALNRRTEIIMR